MEFEINNPVGLDNAIQSIGEKLEALSWLEKVFGRAFLFSERIGGKAIDTPKVYAGKGEYVSVFPNDNYKSFCFFHPFGDEESKARFPVVHAMKKREVALIFWVNLKKIDAGKDYVFTEELKRDIEKVLGRSPNVMTIDRYVDEDVTRVYEGFELDESARYRNAGTEVTQWLMYPYAGMRFDITLGYGDNC